MVKDQCITVNDSDDIQGHASKYDVHRFDPTQPRGVLHRAFSVFLFDSQNRLLLQQRAAGKITFPGVWTNTCCSHPLFGQEPPEVDGPEAVASGSVQGAKTAAVRKLRHELGIEGLPVHSFKYLTRLHYCAADTRTYGPQAEWGEHEMDYILFARADVGVHPNPEEVQGTAFVSATELQEMMAPSSGLLWSPWFRIIADTFLATWWADLDKTLGTETMVDRGTIHRILD